MMSTVKRGESPHMQSKHELVCLFLQASHYVYGDSVDSLDQEKN